MTGPVLVAAVTIGGCLAVAAFALVWMHRRFGGGAAPARSDPHAPMKARMVRDGAAPEVIVGVDRVDAAFARWCDGIDPSDFELERVQTDFARMSAHLKGLNGNADDLVDYDPVDRADFYLLVLQAAALGHTNHVGWPVRSSLRSLARSALSERVPAPFCPAEVFAGLTLGALMDGDLAGALRAFGRLDQSSRLAAKVLSWARVAMVEYPEVNDRDTCRRFLRALEALPALPTGWSDAQRWIVAAGAWNLSEVDGRFAIPWNPAEARASLRLYWGAGSREELLRVYERMMRVGHRGQLARALEQLRRGELDPEASDTSRFVHEHERELRRFGIVSWDMSRMIGVMRTAVAAGWLTEAEGWRNAARAACMLRAVYPSWREVDRDFTLGLRFWGGTHSAAKGEWLLFDPDSYLSKVPWEIDPASLEAEMRRWSAAGVGPAAAMRSR